MYNIDMQGGAPEVSRESRTGQLLTLQTMHSNFFGSASFITGGFILA
jgi:hypothetical protein